MGSILIGLAAIALAVVFNLEAGGYPRAAARLPTLLSWLVGLLACGMIAEAFLARRRAAAAGRKMPEAGVSVAGGMSAVVKAVGFALLLIGYVASLQPLGYLVATPLFLLLALFGLRAVKPLTALAIVLGTVAVVYLVFIYFLRLPISLTFLS